jgi:hypothetical protein
MLRSAALGSKHIRLKQHGREIEMPAKLWRATVRLSNGMIQDVTVTADNIFNAIAILEGQYGKGCIVRQPY